MCLPFSLYSLCFLCMSVYLHYSLYDLSHSSVCLFSLSPPLSIFSISIFVSVSLCLSTFLTISVFFYISISLLSLLSALVAASASVSLSVSLQLKLQLQQKKLLTACLLPSCTTIILVDTLLNSMVHHHGIRTLTSITLLQKENQF